MNSPMKKEPTSWCLQPASIKGNSRSPLGTLFSAAGTHSWKPCSSWRILSSSLLRSWLKAATMEAEGHTRTASLPSLSRQTSEEGGGGGDGGGGGSSSKLGTEDAEDIRETEIELRFQQRVAQQIARMEVTSSEVVRVTPAFRTFEKGAVAFRKECTGDFYFKSERSEKISTFWSHSWHGGHWKLSWDSDECNPFVLCDETILIIFGSQNSLAILIGEHKDHTSGVVAQFENHSKPWCSHFFKRP